MRGEAVVTAQDASFANPWEQIKTRLAAKISSQAFQNWVCHTAFAGGDGGTLRVVVPNQVTKDWMEQEYAGDIRDAIRELDLPVETIVYLHDASPPEPTAAPERSASEPMTVASSASATMISMNENPGRRGRVFEEEGIIS